jgi:DNA repair exonuclease SbcCD ATPase subunit
MEKKTGEKIMAVPFGEKRKTRSQEEQWTQRELKLQDMKARLEYMESALNQINTKINAISNLEDRMATLEQRKRYKVKMLEALEETRIVQEIKEIVRAYPFARNKQPLDSNLESLTKKLASISKLCQNCKNMCRGD